MDYMKVLSNIMVFMEIDLMEQPDVHKMTTRDLP